MIKDDLMNDLKVAMKTKNTLKKDTIQMVRAAILQTEKDKQITLGDNGVLEIIAKQIKQKRNSLEEFEKANREDLVMQTKREIEILMKYMPEMVEKNEIAVKAVEFKVAKNYTKKDTGKLIKDLKFYYGVRASGEDIAYIVKELL